MFEADIQPLPALKDEQLAASHPGEDVWLSASAGTGKTQVLVARVLRLLLQPNVDPAAVLCLTFTKAGAAEMANRLSQRLAHWVRLGESDLRKELFNLGERHLDPNMMGRARSLFAGVLDARGGGLRIQTIHSFAQALLGSFPLEAQLMPGFRPLEGREQAALARRTLAELVLRAEREGDRGLIAALQALSRRLGEAEAEAFLRECARATEALEQIGFDPARFVRKALEIDVDDIEAHISEQCGDALFDLVALDRLATANRDWGTAKGIDRAETMGRWRALSPGERALGLDKLHYVWAKADGELRSFGKGQAPQTNDYAELAARLHGHCRELVELRVRARLADLFAAALEAGKAYSRAYAAAKRAAGVVDFDDMIRATVRLLRTPGMGDWIRFKLDQASDHVLVDEAQDTNAEQWAIVRALADEFFAGEGAKGRKHRTIFSVGDYKQAIFGFQGTDPLNFSAAQLHFARLAEGAGGTLLDLSLSHSFRSTPPVLEMVDAVIAGLPEGALGAGVRIEPHRSARPGPGQVTLWSPVSQEQNGDDEEGEESWVGGAQRKFASDLARQIKRWIDEPLILEREGRPLAPGDIMILVRKRGDLASLIVARLYAEGVPVAGVDRLRLNAPLAVRDLLAAARFALQSDDDLNLASLLVSPLIGWSQDELLERALREGGRLWRQIRQRGDCAGSVETLTAILNLADFTTPYRFFEALLSGPLQGRRRLLSRLGPEALDPIEELLSAALAFEGQATPSLQRFLDWFDRGEVEVVRDSSQPQGAVRVMTAHGAKGLQAPLVILADATTDPKASRRDRIDWSVEGLDHKLPLFRPRKDELAGSLAADVAEAERRDREEHWRLLYVAMTRAEERLVVGGALGPRARGNPPEDSWYAAVARAMDSLGVEAVADDRWTWRRDFAGRFPQPAPARKAPPAPPARVVAPAPAWLTRPAPQEARPPRPLAPSSLGADDVASPPPSEALRAGVERGRMLHALFERLPEVRANEREAAADAWLRQSAGVDDPARRASLIADACRIVGDPIYAALFGPDSLAEAPIAAVVEGEVIAGTVDRLLVTSEHVRIVDFKTARRAPASLETVPVHHLRQMSAYAEALKVIFPDRAVEAALLYTATPVLFDLPAELLAQHKPGLRVEQQSLA